MNHSKYGLNAPFYKWLDDVRRAMRKEQELLQKLEYYNVKFVGYQGITYDKIGSSSGNNSKGDQNMLYWLDKIAEVEKKLDTVVQTLFLYQIFYSRLDAVERTIIVGLLKPNLRIEKLIEEMSLDRKRYYQVINQIVRKMDEI